MGIGEQFATSAGHWYFKDGKPAYTVMSAKGEERATTLRDARKLNLVPSVTTIIRSAAAPGLEVWKRNNLLMSALTLPKVEGESEKDYIDRIVRDSQEQQNKAMQKGTDIHGAIEQAYTAYACADEYVPFVTATQEAVLKHFGDQEWLAERSFASELGFGGKLDLHAKNIVIDFKTKEFDESNKKLSWDEQIWQLAAYREGLEMPEARCANVYISTSVPGLVRIVEHSQEDLERGWECFFHLLKFWQAKNKLA